LLNKIVETLLARLMEAIEKQQDFKLYILVPIVQEGVFETDSVGRSLIFWSKQTIHNAETSLITQLKAKFPSVDLEDYISINSLRNHGKLKTPVTEHIYIHSKIMVVDDRVAIVGSANIGDRNMVGDRDSDLGMYIEDSDSLDSTMNGNTYQVARFAHELRKKLWAEHLGLRDEELSIINDPISNETFSFWKHRAHHNTKIYEEVFPQIPTNEMHTEEEYVVALKKEGSVSKPEKLEKVQGHLVQYPLDFLDKWKITVADELKFKTVIFQ